MRRLLVLTLGVGLAMLMIGVGAWIAGATNTRAAQRASLRQQSDHQVQLVEHYVARASSVILVAAVTRRSPSSTRCRTPATTRSSAAGP